MRAPVSALLFTLLLLHPVFLPAANARPTYGRFVFTAQERGGDPNRKTRVEYYGVNFYAWGDSVMVEYGFPDYVQKRQSGIQTYAIQVNSTRGGEVVRETLTYKHGPITLRKWDGDAAARLKEVYNDDQVLTTHLWAFEAVQRLVSPGGVLLQTVNAATSDQSKCESSEHWMMVPARFAPSWTCTFQIPNDRDKRYTDKALDKLFTRWQTVLGENHLSAVQTEHVLKYTEPVRWVVVRVLRTDREDMQKAVLGVELIDRNMMPIIAYQATSHVFN